MSTITAGRFRFYQPTGYPELHFDLNPYGIEPFDARRSASGRIVLQVPTPDGTHIEVIDGERLSVSKYRRLDAALTALIEQAKARGNG